MTNIILVATYLLLSVSGVVLFKLGVNKEIIFSLSNGVFSLKISLLSIMGLLCYVCSFLMYMLLISKFNLTYITPITTGIAFILNVIAGVLIFKEILNITDVVGSVLILIGVLLISIKH